MTKTVDVMKRGYESRLQYGMEDIEEMLEG